MIKKMDVVDFVDEADIMDDEDIGNRAMASMASHKRIAFCLISIAWLALLALLALLAGGCSRSEQRVMEVTAYCGCGKCCGWERGSWLFLKLDVWNRYVSHGPDAGEHYSGLTASGTKPRQYNPGLISVDSLAHPWMIPVRIVLFPWLLMEHPGSIAADERYFPFGTEMAIPGYGKGVVEDRGSAIVGPSRIDVYFRWHGSAIAWGRKRVEVDVLGER